MDSGGGTGVKKNVNLKALYEDVYEKGAYGRFYTFDQSEGTLEIVSGERWHGKKVLDIGCGEGDLAAILSICGADVVAVDFAESAIQTATSRYHHPNLEFRCCDYREHMDDPLETLQTISTRLLKRPGKIITSSPSFLNPRGYIWMTLQLLLDVPMSLSDLHFLCPFDFERFAGELGAELSYSSVEQDWGHGDRLIVDFDKRLRNALRDRGLTANVDRFLEWLSKTTTYTSFSDFSGALIVYEFCFDS